jgi:hypothetical protein
VRRLLERHLAALLATVLAAKTASEESGSRFTFAVLGENQLVFALPLAFWHSRHENHGRIHVQPAAAVQVGHHGG